MTSRQKNQTAVVSTIIGMIDIIIAKNPSKTVQKKIDTITQRATGILNSLPNATNKEIRSISRRIRAMGEQIFARNMSGIALLSFLISLTEQIIADTIPARPDHKAWNDLHRTLFSLHTYYDRQLKHTTEYAKAADLENWWHKAA